ncbi:ECF transporter S component [Tissierella sp. Yu-01]|uniref:ECF transporter S component n=1 Tax=Tissierella sp. Yu-01 TaxID=3035694 RepID=UPI00240D339F|nr:ECF transporter S component [Tissierella sp. Yu-01]WFA08712.1 ECF transporter S component [Tissierella sp. Yu-01]
MYTLKKETWNTRVMVKISVLSVIAFILMFFEFALVWLAPPFMKLDISDLPALIGALALGPMAGVIIELLKNILNLVIEGSTTGAVGELANFVVGAAFVYTAGAVYYRNKNFKNAIIGLGLGTIVMTIVISIANYYVMFPFYANLFGMPLEELVEMGTMINGKIVDMKSMVIYAIVPFNILKGIVLSALTILIYKRVSPILHN